MKLRNKKTGEIRDTEKWVFSVTDSGVLFGDTVYNSLAELCEEWEDYEEKPPKTYWRIYSDGVVLETTDDNSDFDSDCEAIGNKFETKEEAYKAVEKLKALTRLQNNGFKFRSWRTADLGADKYYFVVTAESNGTEKSDLDLLFGGEE